MKTIKQVKEKLKQRDKKSVVKGLILIVLIIIMILLSVQCVNRYDKRPTGYEQEVSAITEMDYSERQEYVDEKVEEGMININYWVYVGDADYKYIAVGITYESGMWYCDVALTRENYG